MYAKRLLLTAVVVNFIRNINCHKACKRYKEALPNGVCIKERGQTQVQIAVSGKKRDKIERRLAKAYSIVTLAARNSQLVDDAFRLAIKYRWMEHKCGDFEPLDRLTKTIKLSTDDLLQCMSNSKQLVCSFTYPRCTASGRIIIKPCRKSCEEIWNSPECSWVPLLGNVVRETRKMCKAFAESFGWNESLNCSVLPRYDRKCEMIKSPLKTGDLTLWQQYRSSLILMAVFIVVMMFGVFAIYICNRRRIKKLEGCIKEDATEPLMDADCNEYTPPHHIDYVTPM